MKKIIIAITILFISCFALNAQQYLVNPLDPNPEYEYIQDAIDEALASGVRKVEIVVYIDPEENLDSYTFDENLVIDLDNQIEMEISIRKHFDSTDVIIEAENSSQAVIFIGGMGANVLLDGFTITGGSNGVYFNNNFMSVINNCIIEGNTTGILGNDSAMDIKYSVIRNNSDGIVLSGQWTGATLLEDDARKKIEFTEISNNTNHSANLYVGYRFINTTVVDNRYGPNFDSDDSFIINSIVRNESNEFPGYAPDEVRYSNIRGGFPGVGNIDADPLFVNPSAGDYSLGEHSPCINAGDPEFPYAPDGSRADMGAYYFWHDFDTKNFTRGYDWFSFPRLPTDPPNIGQDVPASDVVTLFDPDYQTIDYIEFINDNYTILTWDGQSWDPLPELVNFQSDTFYKIKTEDPDDPKMYVDGPVLDPFHSVYLDQNQENWLGYWIQEPHTVDLDDAFGDNFEHVRSVRARRWYYVKEAPNFNRDDDVPPSTQIRPLKYGFGYIVHVDENFEHQWNRGGYARSEFEYIEPEYFEFEETASYEVIDVMDIEEGTVEIGAFDENDNCIGAVVVRESAEQLLIYPDYSQRRASNITFRYITNRGSVRETRDYSVFNMDRGVYERRMHQTGRAEYTILSLSDSRFKQAQPPAEVIELQQAYPNPFNPDVNISFNLLSEAETSIEVFNIRGQKVKTLHRGELSAGMHSFTWHGKNENGNDAASGIYLFRVKAGEQIATRKALLLK